MRMIRQPNIWSCGAASLAMLLDVDYEKVIEVIGHDGSEIRWPEDPHPPARHRAFCCQELIDCAFRHAVGLIQIDACPVNVDTKGKNEKPVFEDHMSRLISYMNIQPGLIFGYYALDRPHMVAWDGRQVYDPMDGRIYSFEEEGIPKITVDMFFLPVGIKSYSGVK